MANPDNKLDEWCRVTQSKDHGLRETLEVREYHYDPETCHVTEVVLQEIENHLHPSKNRRKELRRKVLKLEEIPEEVRQRIHDLCLQIK